MSLLGFQIILGQKNPFKSIRKKYQNNIFKCIYLLYSVTILHSTSQSFLHNSTVLIQSFPLFHTITNNFTWNKYTKYTYNILKDNRKILTRSPYQPHPIPWNKSQNLKSKYQRIYDSVTVHTQTFTVCTIIPSQKEIMVLLPFFYDSYTAQAK